jgi:hypothetical protein
MSVKGSSNQNYVSIYPDYKSVERYHCRAVLQLASLLD